MNLSAVTLAKAGRRLGTQLPSFADAAAAASFGVRDFRFTHDDRDCVAVRNAGCGRPARAQAHERTARNRLPNSASPNFQLN